MEQERIRAYEEFARAATQMLIKLEEGQQRLQASMRRLEENDRERKEALAAVIKALAMVQADIVRIDESG